MAGAGVQVYLFFGGKCEEAVAFYRKAIGAEVEMVKKFSEAPQQQPGLPAGWENKVMHASLRVGGTTVMASDGRGPGQKYEGFSLSLNVGTEGEADKVFAALSEDGKVGMPMQKTFWSPKFGMCQDKFGIGWMVSVVHK